jgi:ribosomal protein L7/L12
MSDTIKLKELTSPKVTITIDRNLIGQVLESAEVRRDQWRDIASQGYYESDMQDVGTEEATNIANLIDNGIDQIEEAINNVDIEKRALEIAKKYPARQKIQAIKLLRSEFGFNLLEAKNIMEVAHIEAEKKQAEARALANKEREERL